MPGAGAKNMSFGSTVLVPTTANLALGFYLQVYSMQVANCSALSRMAFPPRDVGTGVHDGALPPLPFERGITEAQVPSHYSITGNFMVYQDRR